MAMGIGAGWVQCGCGQCIHEDCINKAVMVPKGCALIAFCNAFKLFVFMVILF